MCSQVVKCDECDEGCCDKFWFHLELLIYCCCQASEVSQANTLVGIRFIARLSMSTSPAPAQLFSVV